MDWREQILKILHRYNAETQEGTVQLGPFQIGSRMLVISPRELSDRTQNKVRGLVPEDTHVEFHVGVKHSSWAALIHLVASHGGMAQIAQVEPRVASISVRGQVDESAEDLWGQVDDLLITDGYFKRWRIIMNGNNIHEHDVELSKAMAKALPVTQRETVINEDDQLNLKIALETASSLEEFFKCV